MTDNQQWQPPAGDRAGGSEAAPASATPYGAPSQNGPSSTGGVPRYGAYAPGASAGQPPLAAGWTPPPKPGLIPLRPLGLGDILSASFQVVRRNPRPTVGISLLWQGVVMLATLVLVGGVTALVAWRTAMAETSDTETIAVGGVAAIIASAIVPVLLSVIASALMQGIVSLEVARGAVGERLRFRGLWSLARGRAWALVGFVLLVTAAVALAIAIVAGAIALLVFGLGDVGVAAGVLLGPLSVMVAVVLAAWLGTKLAVVPSALMIERLSLRQAIARSWTLTNGHFWRVFGIVLLVAVILSVASQVVTTPFSVLFAMLTPLLSTGGDVTVSLIVGVGSYLLLMVVSLLVAAITLVVQSATAGLLYLDLRIRKEGLDLELQHFVEARQAGDGSVRDPLGPDPANAHGRAAPAPWV